MKWLQALLKSSDDPTAAELGALLEQLKGEQRTLVKKIDGLDSRRDKLLLDGDLKKLAEFDAQREPLLREMDVLVARVEAVTRRHDEVYAAERAAEIAAIKADVIARFNTALVCHRNALKLAAESGSELNKLRTELGTRIASVPSLGNVLRFAPHAFRSVTEDGILPWTAAAEEWLHPRSAGPAPKDPNTVACRVLKKSTFPIAKGVWSGFQPGDVVNLILEIAARAIRDEKVELVDGADAARLPTLEDPQL